MLTCLTGKSFPAGINLPPFMPDYASPARDIAIPKAAGLGVMFAFALMGTGSRAHLQV
jgi:hypothetical protein